VSEIINVPTTKTNEDNSILFSLISKDEDVPNEETKSETKKIKLTE
jgi:hypothetical protein